MSLSTLSRSFGAIAAASLLFAVAPASASTPAPQFSGIYAFGDSLSDNGNLFRLSAAAYGLANALPQAADYWNGRFSNGLAAVEVLAGGLGLSNQLYDFAVGGAMSNYDNGPVPALVTGLRTQVNDYAAMSGGHADANALYFVWAGANDFSYLGFSQATATDVIVNLTASVSQLYGMGARNFLLPLLPDFGLTPQGLPSAALLSPFSAGLDFSLNQAYLQLESALPGAHFTIFDTLSAQRALTNSAAANGFNVTDACFTGFVGIPGSTCTDPSKYLYWDLEHPSAYTADVLGRQMLAAVVPEPQTMLLMAAGLLVLLGVARRRQA